MNEHDTSAVLKGDRCGGVKYGLVPLYCSLGSTRNTAIDRRLFTNCLLFFGVGLFVTC